jgi:hypothetical protein
VAAWAVGGEAFRPPFWQGDGDQNASSATAAQHDGSGSDPAQPVRARSGMIPKSKPKGVQNFIDACQTRWQEQGRPLDAADDSLSQWRVHVVAMNKLVAGQITLSQATAFWNQTRLGAIHKVHRFDQSLALFKRSGTPCGRPVGKLVATLAAIDTLDRCVRATAAGDRVLDVAESAIMTWEHHIHDMEMLRSGQLSPTQATRMWVSNWHKGNRQIDRYADAEQRARSIHCA